jgi:hypothetical protein
LNGVNILLRVGKNDLFRYVITMSQNNYEGVEFVPVGQSRFAPKLRYRLEVTDPNNTAARIFGPWTRVDHRPGWKILHVPTTQLLIVADDTREPSKNKILIIYGNDKQIMHRLRSQIMPRNRL